MSQDVNVGQIWEVTTDEFLLSKDKKHFNRQIKLDKGEKIEIRFPFAWNFRTEDNNYFHCEEIEILKHCKLIGVIWDKVKSQNDAKLDEILKLRLYDRIKNQ